MTIPDFSIESEYSGIIVGIDEVGRGPWAGPVVAAAAIVDPASLPEGIRDSKQLSAAKRELLATQILQVARISIGIASVAEIEALNILGATKLAMCRAYEGLNVTAAIALVDGNQPPKLPCNVRTVIKGDSKSLSIAAAAIVAKVHRDHLMAELAEAYPYYAWERNAGYGTKAHQEGIANSGLTPHHRRNFAPIRAIVEHAILEQGQSEPA